MARASARASAGSRASRLSVLRVMLSGASDSMRAAAAVVGASAPARIAAMSSDSRNGFPPVARWQAAVNLASGARSSARSIRVRAASSLSVRGRSRATCASSASSVSGAGHSSGRAASTSVSGSSPTRRAMNSSHCDDSSSAQCASSTTRRSGCSAASSTHSQYSACSRAKRASGESAASPPTRGSMTSSANPAAPESTAARCSAGERSDRPPEQLRGDAERKWLLELATACPENSERMRGSPGSRALQAGTSSRRRPGLR